MIGLEEMIASGSKVAVLGSGAWGTALAKVLADKGDDVVVWARRAELCTPINEQHENVKYLPGARLPENISATTDMGAALDGANLVVFVVPSHATREVAKLAAKVIKKNVPIVSATKGIENDSLMLMNEVLEDELHNHREGQLAFL